LSGKERVDSATVVIRPLGVPDSGKAITTMHVANQVLFLEFQAHYRLLTDDI
jgi:hypothetical protein